MIVDKTTVQEIIPEREEKKENGDTVVPKVAQREKGRTIEQAGKILGVGKEWVKMIEEKRSEILEKMSEILKQAFENDSGDFRVNMNESGKVYITVYPSKNDMDKDVLDGKAITICSCNAQEYYKGMSLEIEEGLSNPLIDLIKEGAYERELEFYTEHFNEFLEKRKEAIENGVLF